jgi:hypothetical protein|tara:strand:+ start:1919 stop:2611 length:693 start_codon:yes stop_codon:yes gene_type:complete
MILNEDHREEFTEDEWNMLNVCKPYTMTSGERLLHTFRTIKELDKEKIEGAIVECGVYKGGQIISAWLGNTKSKRQFWLYDTFEGMTSPTEDDYRINADGSYGFAHQSTKAKNGYDQWCRAELNEVVENINPFIPQNQTKYVVGDVCKTLENPGNVPTNIALLRLDTDWYESTYKELQVLWPKLSIGGICVIDDYNSWQGSKKAFHDVFGDTMKIHTIDQTAIYCRKEQS